MTQILHPFDLTCWTWAVLGAIQDCMSTPCDGRDLPTSNLFEIIGWTEMRCDNYCTMWMVNSEHATTTFIQHVNRRCRPVNKIGLFRLYPSDTAHITSSHMLQMKRDLFLLQSSHDSVERVSAIQKVFGIACGLSGTPEGRGLQLTLCHQTIKLNNNCLHEFIRNISAHKSTPISQVRLIRILSAKSDKGLTWTVISHVGTVRLMWQTWWAEICFCCWACVAVRM